MIRCRGTAGQAATPRSGRARPVDRRNVESVVVCSVCGEAFDEYLYQVCLPGLHGSFDSVDCATRALAAAVRSARLAAENRVGAIHSAAAYAAAEDRGYKPLARYAPVRAR